MKATPFVKLSEKDATVIGLLALRANLPITEIAAQSGHPVHVIRYCLERLLEQKILLNRVPLFNSYRLGFSHFVAYFSLAVSSEGQMKELMHSISKVPSVVWFAEVGGNYQYAIELCTRSVEDIAKFFSHLGSHLGSVLLEKTMWSVQKFTVFGPKYLLPSPSDSQALSYGCGGPKVDIDSLDWRLIENMAKCSFESIRQLAQQTGQPLSTVERHLKKLETSGVISGHLWRYDERLLGMQRHKLLVFSRGNTPVFSRALYEFAKRHPQIINLVECIGAHDFELTVEVRTGQEASQVSREVTNRFAKDINSIHIIQVFRTFVFRPFPTVPAAKP